MPPLSRIAVVAALTIALLAGCRPAPTPTARTIDLLGDSITWQAYWGRTRAFEGQGRPPGSSFVVDAKPGAVLADPYDREAARVYGASSPRPAVLVVALGTNDALPKTGGWTTEDTATARRLLALPATTACVVVILPGLAAKATVTATMRAEMTEARAALRGVAAERARTSPTVVRDWGALVAADPSLTEADGIHLPAGDALAGPAAVYARTIWSGVAACPGW